MKDANNTSKQWNEQVQLTERNRIGFRRLSTTWNWSYKRFMSTFRLKLKSNTVTLVRLSLYFDNIAFVTLDCFYLMFLKVQ